jgi:hypothetical protein
VGGGVQGLVGGLQRPVRGVGLDGQVGADTGVDTDRVATDQHGLRVAPGMGLGGTRISAAERPRSRQEPPAGEEADQRPDRVCAVEAVAESHGRAGDDGTVRV